MIDWFKGGQQGESNSLLKGLVGSREGCFFGNGSPSVDVCVVCHEMRCLETSPGEQAYVSVRDIRRREGEAFAELAKPCYLRTLELDTTLLVRVWVDEVSSNGAQAKGERRVLGEVRIPLSRLISQYNACLYHTWLPLESPGLHDSVSSLGIMDSGSEFDHAFENGPKHHSQPKICLSLCRAADVPRSGKVMWTHDAPNEFRVSSWSPLLRSQQQHIKMSAALYHHLKGERQAGQPAGNDKQTQELQERNKEQVEAIERLQSQLDAANSQMQQLQRQQPANSLFRTQPSVPSQPNAQQPEGQSLSITQARSAPNAEAQAQLQAQTRRVEVAEQRLAEMEAKAAERLRFESDKAERAIREAEELRNELDGVRQMMDNLSEEANRKIEAANDRIRTLRARNSEAEQELNQLKSNTLPLLSEEKATLENENRQLGEQKEALLRIVEDLHQTCVAAGLNTTARSSIDNMTCTITQEFRLT